MNDFEYETDCSLFVQHIARPRYQLRSLPVNFRWEVTRRHPIYQIHWYEVTSSENVSRELAETSRQIRNVALGAIGCISVSIPPETEFEDIDEDEYPAWMARSVHPISNRGIIGLLIKMLPPELLNQIGGIFSAAGATNSEETASKLHAINELKNLDNEILDQFLDELLVSLSPTASVRQLQEDLPLVLNRFRDDRRLDSQRNRIEDYPNYMRVWDMREGWSEGTYHHEREKTFQQIANELNVPISTISNRYRSAYKLITGHNYSPGHWFELFKMLKFSEYSPDLISKITLLRLRRSPVQRDVPNSALRPTSEKNVQATVFENLAVSTESASDVTDEWIDFETFLNQGLSNEQIAQRIGCDSNKIPLIAELRERFGDRPRTSEAE